MLQQPQTPDDDLDLSSEDEQVANDLDMHALILGGIQQDAEPLKTADEVVVELSTWKIQKVNYEYKYR